MFIRLIYVCAYMEDGQIQTHWGGGNKNGSNKINETQFKYRTSCSGRVGALALLLYCSSTLMGKFNLGAKVVP